MALRALLVFFGDVTLGLGPGTAAADAPTCATVTYTGGGVDGNAFEVDTLERLQYIGANHSSVSDPSEALDSHYVLVGDIDASDTATWTDEGNGPQGFYPIGDQSNRFTGTFDGRNHTISRLTIDRDTDYVGLFWWIGSGGTVENVGLDDGSVTGDTHVGGLVGSNEGTVEAGTTSDASTDRGTARRESWHTSSRPTTGSSTGQQAIEQHWRTRQ